MWIDRQKTTRSKGNALRSGIASTQSQQGFTFVYPTVQNAWDASARTTTSGGFHGETLLALSEALMNEYDAA